MTPAIAYGTALLTGMLIGFMFPLLGTAIISVVLACLLFRAAKDLVNTKSEERDLESRLSQAQTTNRRWRGYPSSPRSRRTKGATNRFLHASKSPASRFLIRF